MRKLDLFLNQIEKICAGYRVDFAQLIRLATFVVPICPAPIPYQEMAHEIGAGQPRFSYLEPRYTWEIFAEIGIHGTNYHPLSDIRRGEAFLRDIYNYLVASPQWEDTLLIIAFDEHGGTFDHIPLPNGAINPGGTDKNECGFNFKRYGVRVPMVFVSP